MFLLLIQQILSRFANLIRLLLVQLLFLFFHLDNDLSNSKLKVSNLVAPSFALSL